MNDKLIADFLSWKIDADSGNYMVPILFIINGDYKEWADTKHVDDVGYYLLSENKMEFQMDWNWLMAGVQKLKSLGYMLEIYITSATLENIYIELVEGIKWYNKQSKL